jgi:hypothetical protein
MREHRAAWKRLMKEHPAILEVCEIDPSTDRTNPRLDLKDGDGASILALFKGKPIRIRITPEDT